MHGNPSLLASPLTRRLQSLLDAREHAGMTALHQVMSLLRGLQVTAVRTATWQGPRPGVCGSP